MTPRRTHFSRTPRRGVTALETRVRYLMFSSLLRRRLLWGAGILVGLGIVWIAITGYLAVRQADALGARVQQVKLLVAQGRVDDARRVGADIAAMSRRGDRLTSGPAWWIGAHVPYLGRPLRIARDTAGASEEIGVGAVPQLLAVAEDINPESLRVNGKTIRLSPLMRAAPSLAAADAALRRSALRLSGSPSSSWLSAVDHKRDVLAAQISSIRGYVDAAARVTKVLPTMLGQDRVQRYFIALQNESELRGTGGLPGAFAIARAYHGTITFERFFSDSALQPAATNHLIHTGLNFGRQYDDLYAASEPTSLFTESNISPDFRYAGQIWASMWEKIGKQKIDGVIAVDPTVLSYFLSVTGPVSLPKYGGSINAANVVSLTQQDAYVLFPDNAERKDFLVAVLRAAATKLISGAGSPVSLVRAAGQSASEQRLLAWSRDPVVESALQRTGYGGTLPSDDRPFSGLVLNNAAAGKLDYYVSRSLTYSRSGCGSRRDVIATITLRNDAPASGLPPYVVTRLDADPPPGVRPGDTRVILDYFATGGALLQSVQHNGDPGTAAAQRFGSLSVFRMNVELPRGATQTIVLHLDEPAGVGRPRMWKQPGVTPLAVQVQNQNC